MNEMNIMYLNIGLINLEFENNLLKSSKKVLNLLMKNKCK